MTDLFDTGIPLGKAPLAARLRPAHLDDIIGQSAILAPNSILRRRINGNCLGSVILYGPPGIGKTSIARAIGNTLEKQFRSLNASRASVADLRKLADEARLIPLLIFVDEIQRFSTTQADDLLALCEEGTVDFIGATTGNPYHVLTPALISRSTILKLEPLSLDEMEQVLKRGIDYLDAQGIHVKLTPAQRRVIAGRSGGDARRAITALESLSAGHAKGPVTVTDGMIEEVYAAAPINHDRSGDAHYDVVSAFVKSMRGSDPDATLYWLARLIHGGEDPRYIARRIMIHASEDVGLADNTTLQTAVAALQAVEKIGYPEAQTVLAHAALHVARAPKSMSSARGISSALHFVSTQPPAAVPLHLRDNHYKGAASLGHVGYRLPHDDPRGWVEQVYGPVPQGTFYKSDARNAPTFEKRADDYWNKIIHNKTQ